MGYSSFLRASTFAIAGVLAVSAYAQQTDTSQAPLTTSAAKAETTAALPAPEAAIPVPAVENSKYQFSGTINSDAVLVRSGASENYYPAMRLSKGTQVTVVGIKFDWLKILPPEGSFSYVSKAYVEKRGDGTVGRVTKNDINVRAGSTLNQLTTAIQGKLNEGDDVTILGEANEYFKIKPPKGAYLYVNKQFVDPGQALGVNPEAGKTETVSNGNATNAATPNSASPVKADEVASGAATTQPTVSQAEVEFGKLETAFNEASAKPLDQQPVADLLAGYQKIEKDEKLPESLKRIGDYRIVALQSRQKAQGDLAEAKKQEEEYAKKQQALKAEREELETRLKAQTKEQFAAIGTLRTSSLQQGSSVLFRITDPANGRTLVYIRSNEATIASQIGQFVGVKGEVVGDPTLNLNIITPTSITQLDQNKLNNVTATITPPSLFSQSEASTASETKQP